jgi:hypothetical protein
MPTCPGRKGKGTCFATRTLTVDDFRSEAAGKPYLVRTCVFCRHKTGLSEALRRQAAPLTSIPSAGGRSSSSESGSEYSDGDAESDSQSTPSPVLPKRKSSGKRRECKRRCHRCDPENQDGRIEGRAPISCRSVSEVEHTPSGFHPKLTP